MDTVTIFEHIDLLELEVELECEIAPYEVHNYQYNGTTQNYIIGEIKPINVEDEYYDRVVAYINDNRNSLEEKALNKYFNK